MATSSTTSQIDALFRLVYEEYAYKAFAAENVLWSMLVSKDSWKYEWDYIDPNMRLPEGF